MTSTTKSRVIHQPRTDRPFLPARSLRAITRRLDIAALLGSKPFGRYSCDDLGALYGVSVRVIRRDLDELLSAGYIDALRVTRS